MQIRYENNPTEVSKMDTETLRANFLIESLFEADKIQLTYSHYDRTVIGGVCPVGSSAVLPNPDNLKAAYFLERRELGIINVGGSGCVVADGQAFTLNKLDALYLGRGVQEVSFESFSPESPACFFLLSAPAHQTYPTRHLSNAEATPTHLGETETANKRTIYKYIHEAGIQSCQLVMGLTILQQGNVWNTMPAHTHDRRMEVYCYFDILDTQRVLHLMGQPQETRHLWLSNHQAVISPPWSIHAGCGTANYGFIWGMAGENQSFSDMDAVAMHALL